MPGILVFLADSRRSAAAAGSSDTSSSPMRTGPQGVGSTLAGSAFQSVL